MTCLHRSLLSSLVLGCCLLLGLAAAPMSGCSSDDGGPTAVSDALSGPDVADDDVSDQDADGSSPPDADPVAAECIDGEWVCSDDALQLTRCEDGAWVETACMADHGQLCEGGACVAPWRYGSPVWSQCPDEPQATAASLADKAAHFDEIATRLHIHPELGWIMSARLVDDPAVTEANATWQDVAHWHSGENDGLWSGLYLASQAFRYAVTGSDEALATVRLLLQGEVDRMGITGVPGIFTRQLIPPGVDGIACPTDDASYTTDIEKDDNRWVQIDDDGCARVVDHLTGEWVTTTHCGQEAFAGYCWLDNVSQDEYAGHMMALAALVTLVDKEDVRETAASLIEQVGEHLMVNDLVLLDWDGRPTEHGVLFATSFKGSPGFLSAEALAFVKMAVEVTGRDDLRAFYEECLLQKTGAGRCLPWPLEVGSPYHEEYLPGMGLYAGDEGCKSNYNNFSMVMTYLFDLLWFEQEPDLRWHIQGVLDTQVVRSDSPRALIHQQNAWFNIIWAAVKQLGPDSDGPAYGAVEDAICSLRQFAASKQVPTLDPGAEHPHYCEGRLGHSQAQFPIPVAERCPSTFLWWGSPYSRGGCTEDSRELRMPADYLLAYWMGRYFGFIDESM